jgi:hypothetical protein
MTHVPGTTSEVQAIHMTNFMTATGCFFAVYASSAQLKLDKSLNSSHA